MHKSLFLPFLVGFTASLLMSSCAKKPAPEIRTKYFIPLVHPARIAILPPLNFSRADTLQNWPEKFIADDPTVALFEEISGELENKIGLFSPTNQIKMVHQSENPNYRVQLQFLQVTKIENKIEIPFRIEIFDQSENSRNFNISMTHFAIREPRDQDSKGVYYWGSLLEAYKTSFPYAKILQKLFNPPEK